jgi:2-acylglycerol O-acyltransferase 2
MLRHGVPAGIDIHPMTLEINFKIPFMREFLLLHGVVDASKSACLMTLGKGSGQAILLAVGGAQESLLSRPGTYDIVSRVLMSAIKSMAVAGCSFRAAQCMLADLQVLHHPA